MLKKSRTLILPVVLILIGLFLPNIVGGNNYLIQVMTNIVLYVMMATGLNLLLGFSGQISMGNAAFYGIGAYTAGLLASNFELPFIVCFLAAVCVSFVFGLIIGFPSRKLGAIFLAFVTIAFNNIIYLVLTNWTELTGGSMGMRVGKLAFFGHVLDKAEYYYLCFAIMLIVLAVFYSLLHSKSGRALMAIKGNPIAASAMGINVNRYKLLTFGIAAAMTGAAGCLYAYMVRFVNPDMFTTEVSNKVLTMVIVGGLGSVHGGLVGAVTISVVTELLREFGDYQMLLYGAAIVILIQFAPRGIMGGVDKLMENIKIRRLAKSDNKEGK